MNKNICLISPSLKVGGIERAMVLLANDFAARGLKVSFVSCLAGEHFYQLDEEVNLIEPKFRRSASKLNKLVFYPRMLSFIRRQVKKINPDAVLAFGDWFSPLVLLALYGTKYPVYISDRTSPDYKFIFPIPLMKRWLYPRSAGFIAQTQRAAEYKMKQFSKKLNIRIIPNAIRDVKAFPEINREKIILYVGRFAWEKGPERLIQAFAALENQQGWKLLMAGSGPLLKPMQELAKQLNLENDIIFPGKVEDVDKLYARASIYVLPSVLEGFPNSLCEAMAAGLPVVCFDSIPWEEILEPGKSGLVVKNNDNPQLIETLQKLIKNKELRESLGQNALSIKDRLRVERIGDEIINFIQHGF
jgi:glycosyltransferase involved in cell wall biosynthesis